MIELSYQLYSSRNSPDLSATLKMISGCGYSQVEGYADLVNDKKAAESLSELLQKENLQMPSCHFNLEDLRESPDSIIEISNIFDINKIYIPYLDELDRPNDISGWKKFAEKLDIVAKPFEKAGIEVGWHNHDFEFMFIDSSIRPIDVILTTCESISLEFDIAWAVRADTDPLKFIHQYSSRISAVHLKDIDLEKDSSEEDGWADVGYGTMNWEQLFPVLLSANIEYFVVEHDNPLDDHRFASRSYNYLSNLAEQKTHDAGR
ncbi:MAG: sugar phosphate isomerase/epimerase [Gammaproteobacteria bacterium]|nr:sugar phosphate isomerase/epimerase [Gammaproteobacteria bacterium]